MDNLKQFTAVLDRVRADTVEALHDAQKSLAFEAQRRLIEETPVGNPALWQSPPPEGYVGGHARRNWQVTISEPADNELDGVDPTGLTAQLAGDAVIKSAPQFSQIWISNNVPYIERLEHGHSTQALRGMLKLTFHDIASTYSSEYANALRKRNL